MPSMYHAYRTASVGTSLGSIAQKDSPPIGRSRIIAAATMVHSPLCMSVSTGAKPPLFDQFWHAWFPRAWRVWKFSIAMADMTAIVMCHILLVCPANWSSHNSLRTRLGNIVEPPSYGPIHFIRYSKPFFKEKITVPTRFDITTYRVAARLVETTKI